LDRESDTVAQVEGRSDADVEIRCLDKTPGVRLAGFR
jgi:hypothetical protein